MHHFLTVRQSFKDLRRSLVPCKVFRGKFEEKTKKINI